MVRVAVTYADIKIFIDDLLHLAIKRQGLISIQSWIAGENFYVIEFKIGEDSVIAEYEQKNIWEKILKELGSLNIIP